MSQDLQTYSAQKIKIQALRGDFFQLTINVKTSSGANYDFSNDSNNASQFDNAYFTVTDSNGNPPLMYTQQDVEGSTGNIVNFSATITQDGKISIESSNDTGFWPAVGKYKYSLFTEKVGDNGSTSPSQLTTWIYGEFIVKESNPAFSYLGGIPIDDDGNPFVAGGGVTY
tara:strand:+ start:2960 stop:3469 length:510 start_codon:yes stop_codon:yes gene_type:complete